VWRRVKKRRRAVRAAESQARGCRLFLGDVADLEGLEDVVVL
jgi:hypothetical protein